jgi:lipopolysaccharide export system protein LptC
MADRTAGDIGRVDRATPPRPRSQAAIASARRHSGFVRFLKIALPLAAIAMIAAFGARAWMAIPEGVSVDLASSEIEDGRLVMANPKLDGFTSDNRPYSMVADRAVQDVGNGARIDLEGISASLPFDASNIAQVEAVAGTFDREANTLLITGGMTVTTDNGIKATFASADVGVEDGSLSTSDPVAIELEGSSITADSFSVRERGAVLVFENRVRMKIDPASVRQAQNMTGETVEN